MFGGFVSANHDCSASVIDENGNIVFASSAERYTKEKHCTRVSQTLINKLNECDTLVFFEDLDKKILVEKYYHHFKLGWKTNQLNANDSVKSLQEYYNYNDLKWVNNLTADYCMSHHAAHAATSFYTRPWNSYDDTVMLSIDGWCDDYNISNSIITYDNDTNEFKYQYMDCASIGQMWMIFTTILIINPTEVGTTMGMAAFGEPIYYQQLLDFYNYVFVNNELKGSESEKHDKKYKMAHSICDLAKNKNDIAASLQKLSNEYILKYVKMAKKYGSKLCYAGGVAQNIVTNSQIKDLFDEVWIPPDPSDGGSSLGAAAHAYCSYSNTNKINFEDAYLGHNIDTKVNPREVVDYILENKVCGIANGKAEFGPRALGNRSLIGDVRYDIKDTVNSIKKREKFRPFGPMILEEEFDKWFEGHTNGYMQYICKPKHDLTSVIHIDGTSRVQTVPPNSRSISRQILEEYFERTGIPMLLNTSLNIKGQPMLNDLDDVDEWEKKYNVKIF